MRRCYSTARCREPRPWDESMVDEQIERPSPAAERLSAAVDRLLAEQRPPAPTDAEDAELLAVAALLKHARPETAEPRAAYVRELGRDLRRARPTPAVSRRRILAAGAAGAAVAAGAAGFAIGRLAAPGTTAPAQGTARGDPSRDLTLRQGQWFAVARLADVPPGTVVAFTAGAVLGHVLNQG